ncbi:MAG: putative aspartate aminotransferase [candidate division TM6 bacterium GW2011_GWF2_28_16]|nr:MAG: putative aspartate aminotransferase [candidate division TM6 bacterium GW2011_GWF2_28_16]
MLNIPLSGIKKVEAIVNSSNEYISLSQGALKVGGIPEQIKNYIQEVLKTDKSDYYQSAWGILKLREKLAQVVSENNNINLNINNIIVTHGAIGALSTIFLTLLEAGDEVIIPEPTYPAYEKLVKLARANAVFVSMAQDNKWELNIEKIKQATTSKTKIIIFSNPNNPLGIIIPENIIKELLSWCEENKIYLIIDEAYRDYIYNNNYNSSAKFVNESNYFINVNTFSKSMGMSGWRVGYMVIPESLNIPLGAMQDALLNCTNVPSQYAALFALDHPEFTQEFSLIVKNNLNILENKLQNLVNKNIFSYQKPAGGFFVFLKTDYPDAEVLSEQILRQAKVGLIAGKYFGASGKSYLRLCFARNPEVLIEGLDRINNFFGKI